MKTLPLVVLTGRLASWLVTPAATLITFSVFLCGADSSRAQQKGEVLTATLVARKLVPEADGKEKLIPADTAKPGDVIQYEAVYRNTSDKELRNVQPSLPIPAGSEFVPNDQNPTPVSASLDGTTFAPYPLKRRIVTPEGKSQEVTVPLSEIRALRWTIGDLAPGATASISARVRLLTNAQTAKR